MGRSFTIAALSLVGCGLFPDLSTLGGADASIDAPIDSVADVSIDSPNDAGPDTSAYADVRIPCEERPCVGQVGETCCWFNSATDTCVAADACAGFADLECYGSIQCNAVGETTCCALTGNTICTDEATCNSLNGTPICDVVDSGLSGDPNDNACPGTLTCTGTTTFEGYTWRSCK
ncbi:MAG TPA: hypothetical protein VH054_15190 [Polyangiaceae bacterium]|nr:hypothetical protein [Polyangiaceae bacterium]